MYANISWMYLSSNWWDSKRSGIYHLSCGLVGDKCGLWFPNAKATPALKLYGFLICTVYIAPVHDCMVEDTYPQHLLTEALQGVQVQLLHHDLPAVPFSSRSFLTASSTRTGSQHARMTRDCSMSSSAAASRPMPQPRC